MPELDDATTPALRDDVALAAEETADGPRFSLSLGDTGAPLVLGETEYRLVKKLDGTRSWTQTANEMQHEWGVTVSQAQMQSLLAQLGQHHLLALGSRVRAPLDDASTAVFVQPRHGSVGAPRPITDGIDGGRGVAAEISQIMHRALAALRAGNLEQALDGLAKAHAVDPDNGRVRALHHMTARLARGRADQDARQFLYKQAQAAFSRADTGDVGAVQAGTTQQPSRNHLPVPTASNHSHQPVGLNTGGSGPSRRRLTLGVLGCVVLVVAATTITFLRAHPKASLRVATAVPRQEAHTVFFERPAFMAEPIESTWMAFGQNGRVAALPAPGSAGDAGVILGMLDLPARQKNSLMAARERLRQAILSEGRLETRRQNLDEQQARLAGRGQELRAALVQHPNRSRRKALERQQVTWRREVAAHAQAVARLEGAQAQALQVKQRAERGRDEAEAQLRAGLLKAPFAGEVMTLGVRVGQTVSARQAAVHWVKPWPIKVSFYVPSALAPALGSSQKLVLNEAHIVVGKVVQSQAKSTGEAEVQIEIHKPDVQDEASQNAALARAFRAPAHSWRLVLRQLDDTFKVPTKAMDLVAGNDARKAQLGPVRIYALVNMRVVALDAEVVDIKGNTAWVRCAALQKVKGIVIASESLPSLADGPSAEVVSAQAFKAR